MKAPQFELVRPTGLDEVCAILADEQVDARAMAGGQSLIPLLSFRMSAPELVIDLTHVTALQGIAEVGDTLRVGAMTRQAELLDYVCGRPEWSLLAQTLPNIGHAPIRNRGTVGGSIAHADPAAELGVMSLMHDAVMVAHSVRGSREVAAEDFFDSYYTTTLAPDEVLVEVRFHSQPAGLSAAFGEVSRRRGDFALVAVAVMLRLSADQTIAEARLGYGSMGSRPLRARHTEASLVGKPADDDTFRTAAATVADQLSPGSDLHASAAYRTHVATALTRRQLVRALGGAATSARGSE